jgi:hypothetical protein
MYTVSITLVSAGTLCGAGAAARAAGPAPAFAVALLAVSGFPAEGLSPTARRTPDAATATASTK